MRSVDCTFAPDRPKASAMSFSDGPSLLANGLHAASGTATAKTSQCLMPRSMAVECGRDGPEVKPVSTRFAAQRRLRRSQPRDRHAIGRGGDVIEPDFF